jgi:(p)ppGpp synthase/HD superfamily hydrolase
MNPNIEQTILLMKFFHHGQKDKSGQPYYLHPLRVMQRLGRGAGPEHHAALLHDVLEDTHATISMLEALGYSQLILSLVWGMTRHKKFSFSDRPGETYNQYIDRILDSGDTRLWRLKLADSFDNSAPSRTATLPDAEKGLEKRYLGTIAELEALLPNHGVLSGDIALSGTTCCMGD